MKTIGLIGGVASGKSTAARMLAQLGAGLLDADRIGHEVLENDEVIAALRERWGDTVFTADGRIDRQALAERVFGTSHEAAEDRRFLESLLHPRIRRRLEEQRDAFAAAGRPAVVLDAPLLLEAGWGSICGFILMIDTPRDQRLERARQRGWSDEEFTRREAAQSSLEEKRRAADIVLQNDSTEAALRRQIESFWRTTIAKD